MEQLKINAIHNKKALYSTIAILSLFCLDLVTYITFIPVNITKSIVLFVSAYCFFRINQITKQHLRSDRLDTMMVIYLVMLFLRLIVDFLLKGQTFFVYSNTITIFVFVFGIILIPFFSTKNVKMEIDVHRLTLGIYWILIVCMLLSARNISSGRVDVVGGGRFDANEGLFSILYGHLGVSLIFTSLCLGNTRITRKYRIAMTVVGAFIGILSVVYSGSRGPFLVVFVALLLYVALFIKNQFVSFAFIVVFVILVLNLGSIIGIFNDFLESHGITSFYRVYMTLTEGAESGREELWNNAIKDFIDSPLWGKAYLFPDGTYVHNIFLEQLRSLGIIGGGFFLLFNLALFFRGLQLCRHNRVYLLFFLLYIQYMFMGCFTSTIIVLSQYWLFMVIVFNLCKQYGNRISNNSYL